MPLTPLLPVTITPRPAVKWCDRWVTSRIINETLWIDLDCQFLLDNATERTALAAMTEFSAPAWLAYYLPAGYQCRLRDEPDHEFFTTARSQTTARFEATYTLSAFATAPTYTATAPAWFRCLVPTGYTSQQQPLRSVQRFASNRTRQTDRATGSLHHVSMSANGLSVARFFEFIGWWAEGLKWGQTAFSFSVPGVGSSTNIVGWKAQKRGLIDLELELRVI